MICGKKRKTLLLLFSGVLLLFSSPCYGQPVYDGPSLPAGWYPIHEIELTALDELLDEQETRLMTLRDTLTGVRLELTAASASLEISEGELKTAGVSLTELGGEVGRLRSLSILLGVTTAGGALFILFTIFGSPMVIGD